MRDIFNKEKVKELNQEILNYKINQRDYVEIIKKLTDKNKNDLTIANKRISELEKISSKTWEENQKLINWIMKILDTVGTMEVREKRNFQIPVYLEKEYKAYNTNYMGVFEKERIIIPEITIVKMG